MRQRPSTRSRRRRNLAPATLHRETPIPAGVLHVRRVWFGGLQPVARQGHRSVKPTERRFGIHGAAMAPVARRAALGGGQVYRIFESKAAIIARSAADDRAETRAMLEVLESALGSVVDALCAGGEAVNRCFDARRIALRVEFAAEAARNPIVAEILRSVYEQGRPHSSAPWKAPGSQGATRWNSKCAASAPMCCSMVW